MASPVQSPRGSNPMKSPRGSNPMKSPRQMEGKKTWQVMHNHRPLSPYSLSQTSLQPSFLFLSLDLSLRPSAYFGRANAEVGREETCRRSVTGVRTGVDSERAPVKVDKGSVLFRNQRLGLQELGVACVCLEVGQ